MLRTQSIKHFVWWNNVVKSSLFSYSFITNIHFHFVRNLDIDSKNIDHEKIKNKNIFYHCLAIDFETDSHLGDLQTIFNQKSLSSGTRWKRGRSPYCCLDWFSIFIFHISHKDWNQRMTVSINLISLHLNRAPICFISSTGSLIYHKF